MIRRHLELVLRRAARGSPVVSVTGPRQSGKTTLVREVFGEHSYRTLEDPLVREHALADPRGFLAEVEGGVVLDEVQRVPDLFSYVQVLVDEDPTPGRFVLTGSENFLLSQRISQSLAGRCVLLYLLPLCLGELRGGPALDPSELDAAARDGGADPALSEDLEDVLFRGFYPRIHHAGIDPRTWLASYVATYVERDVRQIVRIGQPETFQRFLRLAAGRTGTLLNQAALANDVGVSAPTVRQWLSVLEASFLLRRLPPHHANFGKRLVKSPKIHFLDSGLLCYLLGIRSPDDLKTHPLRGAIFESFVVSELTKGFVNRGEEPPLYHWRDRTGNEVDLVVDLGARLVPWEVKSARAVHADALDGLRWWGELRGERDPRGGVVHGGPASGRLSGYALRSWRDLT